MFQSHTFKVRVYYEDTDAGGIVYHASYLKFAERARTEMLRDTGIEHARIFAETGIAFAVISMQINFKLPAKLDDLLHVKTAVTEVKGASMGMKQEIYKGKTLLVDIDLRLACLDKDGKAARLPEEVRKLFKSKG